MISSISAGVRIPLIQDHSLRRQLKAELLAFKEVFRCSSLDDEMTQAIKSWCDHFDRALNSFCDDSISVNEEGVLARFIDLMKELLVDPFGNPLEKVSYLGSDGEVYGEKALCCYLSKMSEELKGRSPFHQGQPERLTVFPHPVVERAFNWLQKRGEVEKSVYIEDLYQELVDLNTLPKIPTPKMVRLQERAERLGLERVQREQTAFPSVDEEGIISRIDRIFEGAIEQVNESNAAEELRAETIRAWDVRLTKELEAEVAQLEAEIEEIDSRIDHIEKSLEDLDSKLSAEEKEILRVQLEMEKLQAEIKRKKKKKKEALIKTVVTVACCIGATWMAYELLLKDTVFSVVFQPVSGGAKASFVFAP
jgi:hypothetical protein